jgi:hypothetical protein
MIEKSLHFHKHSLAGENYLSQQFNSSGFNIFARQAKINLCKDSSSLRKKYCVIMVQRCNRITQEKNYLISEGQSALFPNHTCLIPKW